MRASVHTGIEARQLNMGAGAGGATGKSAAMAGADKNIPSTVNAANLFIGNPR